MRHRPITAVLAAAAAAMLALAGCGSSSNSSSDNGPVTIKFVSLAYQPPTVAAVKKIVDSFNASHPKIKVQLVQGSFDTINDQLVTQFQGGTAPDVFHSQASLISNFEQQGYLADLKPYLDKNLVSSVPGGVLSTVSDGEKIYAAPTLLQSYVVFANTDLLKAAGATVPTGSSMSWDQFQALAKQATSNGHFGLGWGLKSADGGRDEPVAELRRQVLLRFGIGHQDLGRRQRAASAYADGADAAAGQVAVAGDAHPIGADTLPGFYARQVRDGGRRRLHRAVDRRAGAEDVPLDRAAGAVRNVGAPSGRPADLSVSKQSKHVEQAAEFINYYDSPRTWPPSPKVTG